MSGAGLVFNHDLTLFVLFSEEEERLQDETKMRRVMTEGREDYACVGGDDCRFKEEGADTHTCTECGGNFHALCTTTLVAGIDVLGFCGRKSCGKASSNEVADACSSKSTPTLTPEVKSRIAIARPRRSRSLWSVVKVLARSTRPEGLSSSKTPRATSRLLGLLRTVDLRSRSACLTSWKCTAAANRRSLPGWLTRRHGVKKYESAFCS